MPKDPTVINLNRVRIENLPSILRAPRRLAMLEVMYKPLSMIYADFRAAYKEYRLKTIFNGGIQYLETALNDRFDPDDRGIIVDDSFYEKKYLYLKIEDNPAQIIYNHWRSTRTYAVGDFVIHSGSVWEANAINTNATPGVSGSWTLTTRKPLYLRMRANYNEGYSFTVYVPSSITYSEAEMRSLINYYKLAGKNYTIINV